MNFPSNRSNIDSYSSISLPITGKKDEKRKLLSVRTNGSTFTSYCSHDSIPEEIEKVNRIAHEEYFKSDEELCMDDICEEDFFSNFEDSSSEVFKTLGESIDLYNSEQQLGINSLQLLLDQASPLTEDKIWKISDFYIAKLQIDNTRNGFVDVLLSKDGKTMVCDDETKSFIAKRSTHEIYVQDAKGGFRTVKLETSKLVFYVVDSKKLNLLLDVVKIAKNEDDRLDLEKKNIISLKNASLISLQYMNELLVKENNEITYKILSEKIEKDKEKEREKELEIKNNQLDDAYISFKKKLEVVRDKKELFLIELIKTNKLKERIVSYLQRP